MGKNKRRKLTNPPGHKKLPKPQSKSGKPINNSKLPSTSKTTPIEKSAVKSTQHTQPTIPFNPTDKILLIGEGDLSFTHSLHHHHKYTTLIPTIPETNPSVLLEKYPQSGPYLEEFEKVGLKIGFGFDVTKKCAMGQCRELGLVRRERGEWRGCVDRVVFNFPHVGGRCRDVNRQVRYNQEMLVQFFTLTTPLLSQTPGSSIIVTLFEGQPYTLWNIRDLARHSGLSVQRSFRFQAGAYPGYRHARTLGVVRGKGGEEAGWRGEEREARSYVFVRKGEEEVGMGVRKRKRRSGGDSDSESESESEREGGFEVDNGDHGDEDEWGEGNESDEGNELDEGNVVDGDEEEWEGIDDSKDVGNHMSDEANEEDNDKE